MAVTFEEQNGSPKERRDGSSFQATRTGLILWDMRDAFVAEILGRQYPFTDIYIAPARSVQFEPWGGMIPSKSASMALYEKAKATIQYATLSVADVLQQDPVTERIDPFSEHIPLDYRNFQWGPGASGPPIVKDESPTRVVKGFHYTKSFRALFTLPANLLTYIDSVNSAAISPTSVGFDNLTFQKETLLFNAPTITRTVDQFGQVAVQVKYKFTYKPNWDIADPTNPPESPTAFGWNGYYRAKTQKFERIYKNDEEDVNKYFRSHPAKNFLDIFGA